MAFALRTSSLFPALFEPPDAKASRRAVRVDRPVRDVRRCCAPPRITAAWTTPAGGARHGDDGRCWHAAWPPSADRAADARGRWCCFRQSAPGPAAPRWNGGPRRRRRAAVRALRGHRPALHRRQGGCANQPGRLRALGRRDRCHGAAGRRGCVCPACWATRGSHQLDSFSPALDGLLDCPHYTPGHWKAAAVCQRHCSQATMPTSAVAPRAAEATAQHRPT